jgi:hypothetical protein
MDTVGYDSLKPAQKSEENQQLVERLFESNEKNVNRNLNCRFSDRISRDKMNVRTKVNARLKQKWSRPCCSDNIKSLQLI